MFHWRSSSLLLCSLTLCFASCAWGALSASQVVILVNRDVSLSGQVAQMYQRLRGIPDANLLRLSMGTDRQITPEKYWSQAGDPIRKYLEVHPDIRCILSTAGVPYTILGTEGSDEGAAFDNELAVVLREESGGRKRHQANPLYLNGLNPYGITDPRLLKMVLVARLDGPDLATITRMVEDAIATEATGLSGLVAGDAQGLDAVTGYGEGDATIRAVVDRLGGAGFPVTLDMKEETWKQPATGVGNQAAGAAFYVGWYALLNFQDVFGAQGLARGSIAWHIASQEAQDIWNPQGKGWCVNLMRRGAAVTLGPVREPYVIAFPHGDVFVEALLSGLTVAEGYWLSLPHVSWAMVILGDPLYRPFGTQHPRAAIVARSYVSTGSNGVLVRGQSSSLLVRLECVGAPGSSTPALSATVEPEMGLAAASGTVAIPAMKPGETVTVRIPSVTAGDDSTSMFRLRLNSKGEGDLPRRIVVEGRLGFSRLTGGLGSKTQLFVNPDGSSVITGQPGKSALIRTDNLQTQPVRTPEGFGLTNVEFAPDGAHVALVMTEPKKNLSGAILAESTLGNAQAIPAGSQFVRWLENSRVLLASQTGLTSHSISGGEDRDLGRPPGKSGNVIPGTEIQFSLAENGQVMVKKGAGELFQEVLRDTHVNRLVAIANDLSLFGGVDGENQLWVQAGFGGKPEAVATGVGNVLWGPISRRALVEDSGHRARVYDARNRSWQDLGIVTQAEWSPDEESLLFVEGGEGNESASLALLSGRLIQKLCPMARMGRILKMAFSADQKRAFLLASLAGELDVWMMPLPPRVPAPPPGK